MYKVYSTREIHALSQVRIPKYLHRAMDLCGNLGDSREQRTLESKQVDMAEVQWEGEERGDYLDSFFGEGASDECLSPRSREQLM